MCFSEVLRRLQSEKQKNIHITSKYTTLLQKYSEKSKELQLLKSCKKNEVKHDEYKSKYEELLSTHDAFVNKSHLQYQVVNQNLGNLQVRFQKEEHKNETLMKKTKELRSEIRTLTNSQKSVVVKDVSNITSEKLQTDVDKLLREKCDLGSEINLLKQKNNDNLKQIAKLTLKCEELGNNLKKQNEASKSQVSEINNGNISENQEKESQVRSLTRSRCRGV